MGCEVDQCCCGCTLKTGSLTIGIVEAVLSAIGLVLTILAATGFAVVSEKVKHTADVPQEKIDEIEAAMTALSVVMILLSVILVLHLVFAVLLCCGANKENPKLVKPWVIYSIITVVLSIILYTTSAIIAFVNGQTGSGVQSLGSCLVGSALKIYFIVVVNSFHKQLTQGGGLKSFA